MRSLDNFNVFNKRVLVRCDFNVPVDKKGNILDDYKIKRSLKTIEYLISRNAIITLMGHMGELDGNYDSKLLMDKIADKLRDYLSLPIAKSDNLNSQELENFINSAEPTSILLLENLKFTKQELDGDIEFAKRFAFLYEVFINDDLSDFDKFYASITGIPEYMVSGTGIALQEELNNLNKIKDIQHKPLLAIIGGRATESKIKFIKDFVKIADYILVGGLIKEEMAKREMLFIGEGKIIYPTGLSEGFDIDEKFFEVIKDKITQAKSIFWYGPLGKIDELKYAKGTIKVAKEIINRGVFTLIAGQEIIDFLNKQKIEDNFPFMISSGEIAVKYLCGEKLPGLVALDN